MKFHAALTALAIALSSTFIANAEPAPETKLRCAPAFGNHAILQQGVPIPVWGWTEADAKITVALGSHQQSTVANQQGEWKVQLAPMPATPLKDLSQSPEGQPLTITSIKGNTTEELSFQHILIGEVWLCSGQSNMAGKVKNNRANQDPNDDLSTLQLPNIRQYRSDTGWTTATPGPVMQFTKVGITFARKLQQELKVPVGILSASVGGTQIHTWTRPKPTDDLSQKHAPGSNYHKHITPLVGTAMRGALWYQGEGNASDGFDYFPKLKQLIGGWRDAWGIGHFPFHVVQLAGIGKGEAGDAAMGGGRAGIREAQFQAMKQITNVGLATAIEIGGPKEHPPNKTDIGVRLAHWALHHQYDRDAIAASGPIYTGFEVRCSTIAIQFSNAKGLIIAEKDNFGPVIPCPEGTELPWLSIQDTDGVWHWAKSWVEGNELLVHHPDVKKPIAVRYAYTNHPVGPYLYNKAGLPAFPFTTETWVDPSNKDIAPKQ